MLSPKTILIISFFVLTMIFCACEENAPALNYGKTKIRIVNVSPDNGAISFFVNDSLLTNNPLSYAQQTNYLNISGGTVKYLVKLNNQTLKNSELSFMLDTNKNYTIFVGGKVAKDSLVYISTKDDLKITNDTLAKVRFINLSPNAPFIDAVLSRTATDTLANFTNLNFKSGADYKLFRAGTYSIKLKNSSNKTTLSETTGLILEKGKIYTLWAGGLVNQSGSFAFKSYLLKDN